MVRCSGGGQVFGFLLSSFCSGGARLEAEAVVAGFDDMAVMRQAIEQCGRHFRISEHAGPFTEAQVRRDRHAGALVELAEQVEKQGSAGRAKRQVTKLIQDHEIASGEALSRFVATKPEEVAESVERSKPGWLGWS